MDEMETEFNIDDLVRFTGEGRRKVFIVKWVGDRYYPTEPDRNPTPILKIREWKKGKEIGYTISAKQVYMEKVGK